MRPHSLAALAAAALLAPAAAAPITLHRALGDSMVLQRGVPATLTGFGTPGVLVNASALGSDYASTVGADGVFRIVLPPQPAGGSFTFLLNASDGSSASVADVTYGDVYLCGGQSNMSFEITQAYNATQAIATADAYGAALRLFTVAAASNATAVPDLLPPTLPWARASNGTVPSFSAVCFFFGRALYDALNATGAPVPIGLINDNVGGTSIAFWARKEAFDACAGPQYDPPFAGPYANGSLYNGMFAPLAFASVQLTGMLWWQSEADAPPYAMPPAWYACVIGGATGATTGALDGWRDAFNSDFWLFTVQLAPFSPCCDGWQQIREAQLAVLGRPRTAVVTATDDGDIGSPYGPYHPRQKMLIGERLAASALRNVYGDASVTAAGPAFVGADFARAGDVATVTLRFDPATVGAGGLVLAPDTGCPAGVAPNLCAGLEVVFAPAADAPAPAYAPICAEGYSTVPDTLASGVWTLAAAEALCTSTPTCRGITFNAPAPPPAGTAVEMFLKSTLTCVPAANWTTIGSSRDPLGVRVAATAARGADGASVVLTAAAPWPGAPVVAAASGYGTWPLSRIASSDGWPALPLLAPAPARRE